MIQFYKKKSCNELEMIGNSKQEIKKIVNILSRSIPPIITIICIVPLIYFITLTIYNPSFITLISVLLLLSSTSLSIILYLLYYIKTNKKIIKSQDTLFNQINMFTEIVDHTEDIVILLDSFGQILNFNPTLSKTLRCDDNSLRGKPLRSIFGLEHLKDRLKHENVILDKLKDVFKGRKAEIISPIWIEQTDEYLSIHLNLYPKFDDKNELQLIIVNGRFLKSDFITNTWLANESSHYIINNDITLINVFCHRLTRNLDGKLPRNQILFIQIALQEALINAIEHGNLEVDYNKKTELKHKGGNYWELLIKECNEEHIQKRKVYIDYFLEEDKVRYNIKDEGSGFDWQKYIKEDNDFSKNITSSLHGVGLQMVKNTFDTISYNETGNEVNLVKYLNMDS